MRLRLVGGVGGRGTPSAGSKDGKPGGMGKGRKQARTLTVVHKIEDRLHLLLTSLLGTVHPKPMSQLDQGSPLRLSSAPVVQPIREAVEAWLSNLATRGKRPSTIKSYRTLLTSAAPELGWLTVADITSESVMGWAGEKRHSGAWSGSTMNRQVGALQSLSRFLAKKRWIAVDPLLALDRAEDDGGDGARAATTEEARALIRYAWERQQIDRRAVGNRALVWHCMFTMGLRAGEPGAFTWGSLFLDEQAPFVRWTRAMHKAFRPCEVAVCDETKRLLVEHRLTVPHGQDDLVFPILPPRVTFRKDRDAAGIEAYDRRGRGMSPHSARKWFSHTLTVAGVEGRVIDTLMRHSRGTPGRYPDLLPADQAHYLALLPKLWPGNYPPDLSTGAQPPQGQPDGKKMGKSSPDPIADGGHPSDTWGVLSANLLSSASPPRSVAHQRTTHLAARRAGDSEDKSYPEELSAPRHLGVAPVDSTGKLAAIHKILDLNAEALRLLGSTLAVVAVALGLALCERPVERPRVATEMHHVGPALAQRDRGAE